MEKILIIEDDEKLRKELEIFLNKNGYEANSVIKFDNIIEDILSLKTDLILLDINLPILDGQYICKEIRKTVNTPIIMITSRNNEIDELLSMNYGADDYLTKPFNIQILKAKISAILKRTNRTTVTKNKLDCGNYILNISKSTVEKDAQIIELTKNEFQILYLLSQKKGEIVQRVEIMDHLWNTENFIDDNTLTVNITRLKNKLEEINLKDIIETKRGQGYMLK